MGGRLSLHARRPQADRRGYGAEIDSSLIQYEQFDATKLRANDLPMDDLRRSSRLNILISFWSIHRLYLFFKNLTLISVALHAAVRSNERFAHVPTLRGLWAIASYYGVVWFWCDVLWDCLFRERSRIDLFAFIDLIRESDAFHWSIESPVLIVNK
jgi:hypothetical protein